ncbi:hypothetical protein B0O99DRAFT_663770 [Bisporella sp. PMI_857]|nr:hypothetical protein B0O99DRAFT_663770 [Bisporella sp. PMI_857]
MRMDGLQSFICQVSSPQVISGSGSITQLAKELESLQLSHPLLLSNPYQADKLAALSRQPQINAAGAFSEANMHTPTHVTEKAISYAAKVMADSVMTPILGETENGLKETRNDPKLLPTVVIYDVDLTMGLPAGMSITSGVNAIAHSIEALYSPNGNPIINLLALESIRSLVAALPVIIRDPSDRQARTSVQYGAWLAGLCLGSAGTGLHHKLCHTLGGSFSMPHAETHTAVLPHALSYNAPQIPAVMQKLADILPGSHDELKVEKSLQAFGFKEEDIGTAAEIARRKVYLNPRPVQKEPVYELIRRVWAGESARADL